MLMIIVISVKCVLKENSMKRLTWMLLILSLVGCKVSTSVFIEKDWNTDDSIDQPDLRARYEIRTSRDFNSWEEIWLLP